MQFVFLSLLTLIGLSQADSFSSPWDVAAKSRARLIADASGPALQITLAPHAVTYWRTPGDAGVPPSLDFHGSENLANAQIQFPLPERIAEPDGSVIFGYHDSVILPLLITPQDPKRPVHLVVHGQYGVCAAVCLAAKVDLSLTLPANSPSPYQDLLTRARQKVPQSSTPETVGARLQNQGSHSWRLCFTQTMRALFVEAPALYEIITKPEGRCYQLNISASPEPPVFPIPLRVTLTTSSGPAKDVLLHLTPKP